LSSHCSTGRTIKQLSHDTTAKALTLRLDTSACLLQLIVTTTIFLSKMRLRLPSSGLIEVLTEFFIEVPSLKSKDEVVEDDARPDENYGPLVML
jgi:hypothetical protein